VRRLWEIDAARTAAILMMVTYHAGFDVWWLAAGADIDPSAGGWRALQVATGSSFMFLVGLSHAVASRRKRERGLGGAALWRHHARRAGQVLGAALLVTAVTYAALGGEDYVRFGILHCIGTTMLLLPLLVRLGPWVNAVAAIAVIAAGKALEDTYDGNPLLLPLGWRFPAGSGTDYYPLLPWLGLAMLGLAAGLLLYPRGERGPLLARLLDGRTPRRVERITWPGRHALPIYLVHQPVLIGLVAVILVLAGVGVDPRPALVTASP